MVFHLGFPAGVQAGAAYDIERSLMFVRGRSTSLRTTAASAASTFTVSLWFKLGQLSGQQYNYLFCSGAFGVALQTTTGGYTLYVLSGGTIYTASGVYRDPSAFYHLTYKVSAGTGYVYINNDLVLTCPASSLSTAVDATRFGQFQDGNLTFDGTMATPHLILDQALDPDLFAEVDPKTGQWRPTAFGGSYGLDDIFLPLDNNASTTTLGEDASGNGNNVTLVNFTIDDSVTDTPTNVFPTLNPLEGHIEAAYLEANLKVFATGPNSGDFQGAYATIPMEAGRWYAEFEAVALSSNCAQMGVASYLYGRNGNNHNGGVSGATFLNLDNPSATVRGVFQNGVLLTGGDAGFSFSVGDIIGVAFDADARTVRFFQNGTELGVSGPYDVADVNNGKFFFWCTVRIVESASNLFGMNFGQKPFAHTPPAGFQALSTANLDNPGDASPLTGTFTGNASADGPFVYLGYPPDTAGACTINGNAITWGTHADALANGFKLRTSSAAYNASGSNSYSIAIDPNASFADNANAQVN